MVDKQQVTEMVLTVDLKCCRCYKKVKKILCKIPQIQDQVYNEAENKVVIKVVSCCPERIKEKIICKAGGSVKCIEIIVPEKPKPRSEKDTEKKEKQVNDPKPGPDDKSKNEAAEQKKTPDKEPTAGKQKAPPPCCWPGPSCTCRKEWCQCRPGGPCMCGRCGPRPPCSCLGPCKCRCRPAGPCFCGHCGPPPPPPPPCSGPGPICTCHKEWCQCRPGGPCFCGRCGPPPPCYCYWGRPVCDTYSCGMCWRCCYHWIPWEERPSDGCLIM